LLTGLRRYAATDLSAVGAGTSASGIAADAMGNVYAADVGAHRVYLRLR